MVWCFIVLYGIALYHMKLHDIALLACWREGYISQDTYLLYTKTAFVSLSNKSMKKCLFCLWTKGKQILLRIQVDRDHKVSLSPSWLNVKGNNMKSLANIKLSLLDHSDSRHHISGTSPPKSAAAVNQYLFNFYSALRRFWTWGSRLSPTF